MIVDNTQTIWYKKYLPQRVQDVILPSDIKNKLQKMITEENIPHLGLFSSNPGTGKSSTAYAIITELGCEAKWINASLDKGIDVLRGTIAKFASRDSFDGKIKIVVMDEVDNFSQDGQKAFRGFIDEFSENCRFIFTGNYKEKIIGPLLDRLEVYDYNNFSKSDVIKPIFERLEFILENENIIYEKKDLIPVINTFYPSIRAMVGTLQKFSLNGTFKVNQNDLDNVEALDVIVKTLLAKDYENMILRVNSLVSPNNMYSFLYNNMFKYFNTSIIPSVTVFLAEHQHMSETVRDKHLNLSACLYKIMSKI